MYENILAVSIDDNEQNLMLLEAFADQLDLKVTNFSDSKEAFEFITSNDVDIIFTDYMMPKLNGIDLISNFRKTNKSTPIIMITAAGEDIKGEALEAGATDFLNKPLDLNEFMVRTKNLLELRNAQLLLQDRAKQLEAEVKEATMEITERELESLMVLGKTAEFKDPETAHHVARVANYSKLLAKKYNLSQDEQDAIFYASPFHDIGKVGIRDEILLKPAKLTDEEFEIMKTHSTIGYEILKDTKGKYLQLGASIALYHHEKYDGSGYPHGLKGEDIPIEARIVAVADVFDALVSKRPYKKAWSYEDAIELLKSERAKHFDPKLLNIFIDSIDEIKKINQKYNQ